MKIRIAIASAAITLTNDEGETVYQAAVENYSIVTDPTKLAESIGKCAGEITQAIADASAKIEAL